MWVRRYPGDRRQTSVPRGSVLWVRRFPGNWRQISVPRGLIDWLIMSYAVPAGEAMQEFYINYLFPRTTHAAVRSSVFPLKSRIARCHCRFGPNHSTCCTLAYGVGHPCGCWGWGGGVLLRLWLPDRNPHLSCLLWSKNILNAVLHGRSPRSFSASQSPPLTSRTASFSRTIGAMQISFPPGA